VFARNVYPTIIGSPTAPVASLYVTDINGAPYSGGSTVDFTNIASNVYPSTTLSYSIGSSTKRWDNVCSQSVYANYLYTLSSFINVGSSVVPTSNGAYALGSSTNVFSSVFANNLGSSSVGISNAWISTLVTSSATVQTLTASGEITCASINGVSPSEFATTGWTTTQINTATNGMATQSWVNTQITGMATQTWTNSAIETATADMATQSYVNTAIETALGTIESAINAINNGA